METEETKPELSAQERVAEMKQEMHKRDSAVYGFVGGCTAIVRGVKHGMWSRDEALRDIEAELRKVYEVLGWDVKELE